MELSDVSVALGYDKVVFLHYGELPYGESHDVLKMSEALMYMLVLPDKLNRNE